MKKNIIMIAVVLSMAATSCSADESTEATSESKPTTSASTPTPEPVGLKETCPEIEVALPEFDSELDELNEFATRLQELSMAGDTETQNAIELLDPATMDLRQAVATDAAGAELLAARGAWIDAISAVADRCRTAGSSALQ